MRKASKAQKELEELDDCVRDLSLVELRLISKTLERAKRDGRPPPPVVTSNRGRGISIRKYSLGQLPNQLTHRGREGTRTEIVTAFDEAGYQRAFEHMALLAYHPKNSSLNVLCGRKTTGSGCVRTSVEN